jgi:hypothetical protein
VPDPAAASGSEAMVRLAFADTFRMLSNRIGIFASLPLRSLDRMTLQRQLDSIGKTKNPDEAPGGTQDTAACLDRAAGVLKPNERV